MKRLCKAPNIAIAQLWADTLLAEGIACTVQRHYASSIAGDIPPDQALPELWVMDEAQHAQRCTSLSSYNMRPCNDGCAVLVVK